jgi:hypothetical protein
MVYQSEEERSLMVWLRRRWGLTSDAEVVRRAIREAVRMELAGDVAELDETGAVLEFQRLRNELERPERPTLAKYAESVREWHEHQPGLGASAVMECGESQWRDLMRFKELVELLSGPGCKLSNAKLQEIGIRPRR